MISFGTVTQGLRELFSLREGSDILLLLLTEDLCCVTEDLYRVTGAVIRSHRSARGTAHKSRVQHAFVVLGKGSRWTSLDRPKWAFGSESR